jgi:hypothetical protein
MASINTELNNMENIKTEKSKDKPNIDRTALANQGIPERQGEAFAEVAQQQNCIILSRVPGPSCLDLLEAGYDAKSFHIKGKSCNWGPMAGFVCLDPLLNKNGIDKAASNAKEHKKSLTNLYEGKTASCTPIQIEQQHLDNLINSQAIEVSTDGADCLLGTANNGILNFSFMLQKSGDLWGLYYCLEEAYSTIKKGFTPDDLVTAFTTKLGGKWEEEEKPYYTEVAKKLLDTCPETSWKTVKNKRYAPILAMTNPNIQYPTGDYRNAITGDYDLFAIWPLGTDNTDKRVAGMKKTTDDKKIVSDESSSAIGTTVGNISERIYLIAQMINSVIDQKYGKPQPNRVYHSDEGGRPFVKDLDLPVAVFTPEFKEGYRGFIVSTVEELSNYIKDYAGKGYTIFVNKGWQDVLGKYVKPELLAQSEKI